MKIAELRCAITFAQLNKVQNETFNFDNVWTNVITTKGKLESFAGSDFDRGANANLSNTHVLTIRYRNDINQDMRIQVNNEYYKPTQIDTDVEGRPRYTIILLEQEKEVI